MRSGKVICKYKLDFTDEAQILEDDRIKSPLYGLAPKDNNLKMSIKICIKSL